MERLATDAMAVACILMGGVAGTAVTLAALDRDGAGEEAPCMVVRSTGPTVSLSFPEHRHGTARVVKAVTRRQLERTSEVLEARSREMERRLQWELERSAGGG